MISYLLKKHKNIKKKIMFFEKIIKKNTYIFKNYSHIKKQKHTNTKNICNCQSGLCKVCTRVESNHKTHNVQWICFNCQLNPTLFSSIFFWIKSFSLKTYSKNSHWTCQLGLFSSQSNPTHFKANHFSLSFFLISSKEILEPL